MPNMILWHRALPLLHDAKERWMIDAQQIPQVIERVIQQLMFVQIENLRLQCAAGEGAQQDIILRSSSRKLYAAKCASENRSPLNKRNYKTETVERVSNIASSVG